MEVFEDVGTGEDFEEDDDQEVAGTLRDDDSAGNESMPSAEQREFAHSLEDALNHASKN
jgi:hypothetical protein